MKKRIYIAFLVLLCIPFLFNNARAQWVQTNGPYEQEIHSLNFLGTDIYAGSSNGLYHTSTNGDNWDKININGNIFYVNTIAPSNGLFLIGAAIGGIYRSTDEGISWSPTDSGIPKSTVISSIILNNGILYAGTQNGIYVSYNKGSYWIQLNDTLVTRPVQVLFAKEQNIFCGMQGWSILISSDSGATWEKTETPNSLANSIYSLASNGNSIFAGTGGNGVLRSTDSGIHWSYVNKGLTNYTVYALAGYDSMIFAGTDLGGVFFSNDNGDHWSSINQGLPPSSIYSLLVTNGYLFVGTFESGVWRRPLSDFTTAVDDKQALIPSQIALHQNHPDPFDATTTIEFSLPQTENASLNVFNTLGEEVATLIHGETSAGTHSVQFHAENLQPGIYFYRLTAGSSSQTGKMILTR